MNEDRLQQPASHEQARRERQRARNRVLGLLLGGLALLFFGITIVKLGMQGGAG